MDNVISTFFSWEYIKMAIPDILRIGIENTLLLSALSTLLGLVIGMTLAVMSISRHMVFKIPARIYIDIFRGLPIIVTIFLVGLGLPIAGVDPFGQNPYPYGIMALGIVAGAYIAEILRSGIQSVDPGQMEAARSLGMPYTRAMARIIVPQGLRRVLPALTNQFISTIKDSSLIFNLGLLAGQREIFRIGQGLTQQTGNVSPLVACGAAYLIITVPLTYIVEYLDRRLRRGRKLTPDLVMSSVVGFPVPIGTPDDAKAIK